MHKATPLWKLGTQPPLLIVSYGRWLPLPNAWNVDGLGGAKKYTRDQLKAGYLLHWNGFSKPWYTSK